MMANPLRECYKRGKRWCRRRLANLGKERESMIHERKEKRNSNRERSSVPSPRLHGKHTEGDKVQVGS